MKTSLIFLLIVCSSAFAQTTLLQTTAAQQPPTYTPEKGSTAETQAAKNQKPQWACKPNPVLPNVLLLGDSISIGYTLDTRKKLAGKANVFRPVKKNNNQPENCQGTTHGVRQIDRWLAMQEKWDVIHFNWGLHDLKHWQPTVGKNSNSLDDPRQAEPEAYRKNLETIVKKLKATGAKLIFATTTPYPDGCKPTRLPADAQLYNEVATKVMEANNIPVNDLNSLVKDRLDELQRKANVHFNKAGNLSLIHI